VFVIDFLEKISYHSDMPQTTIKERVFNIESELAQLKKTLKTEPDFDIDERNWNKVKGTAKKIRGQLYKKYYEKK
jgi:hypothetical protein